MALQKRVRDFAEAELRPGAAQRDACGEFPAPAVAGLQGMGLLGLPFPERYGGGGGDLVSYLVAVEELARVDASATITLLAHTLCASHLRAFASEARAGAPPCPAPARGGAGGLGPERAGSGERRRRHQDCCRGRHAGVAVERHQVLHHQRVPGLGTGAHG